MDDCFIEMNSKERKTAKVLKSPGIYGGYRCERCGGPVDKQDCFCRWCGVKFDDD